MTETESETAHGAARSRATLAGTYLAAAALGYVLGAQGLLPFEPFQPASTSTPLARIGLALRNEKLEVTPAEAAALRADVEAVRATWPGRDGEIFELVAALRGLRSGGNSEWSDAERRCQVLRWPRCDRLAVEELKRRSVP